MVYFTCAKFFLSSSASSSSSSCSHFNSILVYLLHVPILCSLLTFLLIFLYDKIYSLSPDPNGKNFRRAFMIFSSLVCISTNLANHKLAGSRIFSGTDGVLGHTRAFITHTLSVSLQKVTGVIHFNLLIISSENRKLQHGLFFLVTPTYSNQF